MTDKVLKNSLRAVWIVFGLGFVFVICFVISIYYNSWNLYGGLPSLKKLENPDPDLASELFSADGESLGKYFRYNRTPVTYDELSPELVETLLVTEDIRFYEHSGIDLKSLMRVAWGLATGNRAGGGSTISQQLAKNLFRTRRDLNTGKIKDIKGLNLLVFKLKEWIVAVLLEKSYTKDEILAMYLNTAEFGSNSYGIKVAAQTFYNKLPSQLNYQESAMLVGVVNAPTRYSPVLNPDNALAKRTEVLFNLYKYEKIDRTAFDSLKVMPLGLQYRVQNQNVGPATYFRTVARNFLLRWTKDNGYDLFDDGLRIFTTLDGRMQQYAEEAVDDHMRLLQATFDEHWQGDNPWRYEDGEEIEEFLENAIKRTTAYKSLRSQYGEGSDSIEYYLNQKKNMQIFTWEGERDTMFSSYDSLSYYKRFLQAGFMAMDPHSGEIKAWVGGINHKYFKFDHVKQGRRQPGSTIKPFVYTAAIDLGYSPCFEVTDAPVTFQVIGDPPTWTPDNSNGRFTGERMTIRRAMANSVNSITAFMMKTLKPETVVDYAHRLGIESDLDPVPALCLGAGGDVSVYEMVGAYSTFVNKGVWTKPHFINRIEDKNGNVIKIWPPERKEALSEETAYVMLHMLKGTTEEPGGTALGLDYKLRVDNEIGAKTGTTQNASDGWFMGVTNDLVAGAWVGGDDRSIHFKNWAMGQGARTAMPIWAKFMEKVYQDETLGYEKGVFQRPPHALSIELDCDQYNQLNQDSEEIGIDEIDEDDIF